MAGPSNSLIRLRGNADCPPFDNMLTRNPTNAMNMDQIRAAFKFYDEDPNVDTCRRIRLDALFNGPVKVTKGGKEAKGEFGNFLSRELKKMACDILRSMCSAGFVACTWKEDPNFIGTPVVLDLPCLEIDHTYEETTNTHGYTYYKRDVTTGQLREILNVATFTFDAPDAAGCIRSMMMKLRHDNVHETLLTYFDLLATKNRAMPMMITELALAKHDPNNVTSATNRIAQGGLLQESIPGANVSSDNRGVTTTLFEAEKFYESCNGDRESAEMHVHNLLQPLLRMPYFAGHSELPQGQTFVSAPMPEGPGELLLKFRLARMERTFTMMGVPLAMLRSDTSVGTNRTTHKTEGNSDSFVVFENSQQTLKADMVSIMRSSLYGIYMKQMLKMYMESTPKEEWSLARARESVTLTVEILSLPNEERLEQMYIGGYLKYAAFVSYLSARHGIPIDHFNEKPEITVPEANGIMPETPEGGPPKKKAKK
jgi:hypothetical protein